ncbi:MAG: lactate racemase domain-containing protein [Planctomycetota bacterium]
MTNHDILLAVGERGMQLHAPDGVELLPISAPLDPAPLLSVTEQQRLIENALVSPQCFPALKELAQAHRRVALIVGDLALPAPYDLALPTVIRALVEAGIRPARITILTCPGDSGPAFGRCAIQRYGEETLGDYEFKNWRPESDGEADAVYTAADWRIGIVPMLAGSSVLTRLPAEIGLDLTISLELGRKLQIDLVAARCRAPDTSFAERLTITEPGTGGAAVSLCSGGGSPWETTLEAALLSLHYEPAAMTMALAFSGSDGIGSARFTQELWTLLQQADEILESGESLTEPGDARFFDPATTLAAALSRCARVILYSPGLSNHLEGDELVENLACRPCVAERMFVCGDERDFWELLARQHGSQYKLRVNPLGWRAFAQSILRTD